MATRLDGWKDIAAYLGRNVRTAQRWHSERGMPVHRVPGGRSGLGSVYALTDEIDEWLRSPRAAGRDEDQDEAGDAGPAAPGPGGDAQVAQGVPGAQVATPSARHRLVWGFVAASFALGALLGQLWPWPWATGRPSGCALSVEPASITVPDVGGRPSIRILGDAGCEWQAFVPVPWMRLDRDSGTGPATLTLALPANHTTSERVATLLVAGAPVRVVQVANPTGCRSTPGPGFVKDGYRYRITARSAWGTDDLRALARAEGGPKAEGFGWRDLMRMLDGHPEEGERFAREVGMYQHSWESTQYTGACFNYWLIENDGEAEFATYHAGMKGKDYKSYKSINENQFDLGRWNQQNQVLYRVPEPASPAPPVPSSAPRGK